MTSLSAAEAGPAWLLQIVREHWGQENSLHYRRDVTLKEDAGRTQDWTVAQAFSQPQQFSLAVLLRDGKTNAAQARRYYAAHAQRDQALKLLLTTPN